MSNLSTGQDFEAKRNFPNIPLNEECDSYDIKEGEIIRVVKNEMGLCTLINLSLLSTDELKALNEGNLKIDRTAWLELPEKDVLNIMN